MMKNNMYVQSKGFTLIEVLAVFIVMSLLALLVIPNIDDIVKNAKETSIQNSIKSLKDAANNYYNTNVFKIPAYEEDLVFNNVNLLIEEGYANSVPKNLTGSFFLIYTSQDTYQAEVILKDSKNYYTSIQNLGSQCGLYEKLCNTIYQEYYEQECICP